MVDPYDIIPIIYIEGYGNTSAVTLCEKLDIKSCKEYDKLKRAKDEVYLKGFYEGILLIGECNGMKVCDAKPIIRQNMIEKGMAISYYEPESLVMSRSGDECIVALCDQWYLSYGEEDWKNAILTLIHDKSRFNLFNDRLTEQFELVIGWLKEWACSRQFGLGTKLPWDEQWVIESLSDSTIYMAYYTIAHYFHGDLTNPNCLIGCDNNKIQPNELNDEIFDYIFLNKPLINKTTIPLDLLNEMKQEFEYWYPMDLRVSAKDLIQNHLTMSLYNHVAIWKDQPDKWPRGIYCNGHVMVDAEKMSKSKGNFLMLEECVEEYTADATRFALADAGDTLDDANFDRTVANNAILSLYVEEEWIRSIILDIENNNLRITNKNEYYFLDKAFENEINILINATALSYDNMCFRDGMHRGWYDMIILRDIYRDWSQRCNIPMNRDLIIRYIEVLTIIMSPIIPHWSELIWELIQPYRKSNNNIIISVCQTTWPISDEINPLITAQFNFFKDFLKNSRQAILKHKSKPQIKPSAYIYLASTYELNKIKVLEFLITIFNKKNNTFPDDFINLLKGFFDSNTEFNANDKKLLMQFGAFMKNEAIERGIDALASQLDFDQKVILEENTTYILQTLGLENIGFYYIEDINSLPSNDKKKKMVQYLVNQ